MNTHLNRKLTSSPVVNVMMEAAGKAARNLRRDLGEVAYLQTSINGGDKYAQKAAEISEKTLRQELQKHYPAYTLNLKHTGILEGEDPDRTLVVDSLCGLRNFAHGLPHFALSIAMLHKGKTHAALILDVMRDECFWSAIGKGAFLNEQRLRVTGRKKFEGALLLGARDHVIPEGAQRRNFGCLSLGWAYVAAGRADMCLTSPWSQSAGELLVLEAGGAVDGTMASNGILKI